MNVLLIVIISILLVGLLFLIIYRNKKYARQLVQLYQSGAQLIDVRSAKEFSKGTIDGAINIPHDQISDRLNELDKDKDYITFCSQGVRSVLGKKTLEKHYFKAFNGGSYEKLKNKLENK